jgi:iron complex outermembrane receptor protein
MRHHRYALALSVTAIALLSTAMPSHAQVTSNAASADTTPDGLSLSEVVVTAQKRTERLSDVPASISVVSGDELVRSRISSAGDLVQLVPNLQMNGAIGENQPIYSIRGVSMNDYSLNQNAPIATYYDEVYKGNVGLLGIVYYDLERVEVLRGPQGTLYGKNATGGAVNLITHAPTFDTEGYLNLTGGNYGRFEAQGAVQAPLSPTVAARVAFTVARADGWFKDLLPGRVNENQTRYWGMRVSLLFKPSDEFSAILRASTSDEDPIHAGIYAQPGPLGVGAGVYDFYHSLDPVLNPLTDYFRPAGMSPRSNEANFENRDSNRTYSTALTAKYEVSDTLELTSITSYDHGTYYYAEDADGSPLSVFVDTFYDRVTQFTQDLRIASKGNAPFQFLLGGYYFYESVFNASTLRLFQDIDANLDGVLDHNDCVAAFPIGCDVRNRFDQKKTSVAIYSDGSYKLTDRFTLRGGLRYTHDRATLSNFDSQAYGTDGVLVMNLIPGSTTDLNATTGRSFTSGNVSGKVGLDFKATPDSLLYLLFSRGYRGGSFNGQAYFSSEELSTTRSEIVNAYEMGAKNTLLERRLQLNTSAFYYRYENQQFIDVDPVTGAQPLVNLPKSRIFGAEVELLARLARRVKISGGAGFLDTKILEGTLGGQDVRGNSIVNAPRFSATLAIDWNVIDASWGQVSMRLDGSYSGTRYFDLQNRPITTQSPYGIANARVGWRSSNDRFGVDLWVRNITDKFYATDKIDVTSGFGFIYNRVGNPRTFGATVSASF